MEGVLVVLGVILVIVLVLAALWAYLTAIYLFFTKVAPFVFAAGAALLSGWVLVNYLRALGGNLVWGSGPADAPHGPEPAFKQYFFRKAIQDYMAVLRDANDYNRDLAEKVWKVAKALFSKSGWSVITWPLGLTFCAVTLFGALVAAAVYVAFGLVHLGVVLSACAIATLTAIAFRLFEYISMAYRQVFVACPHPNCYQKIALPLYFCPTCGAQHRRLIPGSYGTFRRRCACGTYLPTLFLFGRNRLPSICPHCSGPLNAGQGQRLICIPIVGGPSAGKTSYLVSAMVDLQGRASRGALSMAFPDETAAKTLEACQKTFSLGAQLLKTTALSPSAFQVALASRGSSVLLSLYDPAGEAYGGMDSLRGHTYLSYFHGVLFLIDPFAIPEVCADHEELLRTGNKLIRPSPELVQDVYDRFLATLRGGLATPGKVASVPFAVVVTKSDVSGIGERISAVASSPVPGGEPDATSASIRAWLSSHGCGNLVRCIDRDFKRVRYFVCSPLGRIPDSSGACVPVGVGEPLGWLLSQHGFNLTDPGKAS